MIEAILGKRGPLKFLVPQMPGCVATATGFVPVCAARCLHGLIVSDALAPFGYWLDFVAGV